MKKMMNILAAAMAIGMALPTGANAQTFEDDYFVYEVINTNSSKVLGFSHNFSNFNSDGSVTLDRWAAPELELNYDGSWRAVAQIGDEAFSPDNPLYASWPEGQEMCRKIASLNTAQRSGITRIGDKAFMNCENLIDVHLGNNTYPHQPMNYIGKYAFYGTKLYSVLWTADCPTIEDYCFANIPTLNTFYFQGVVTIGEGAFQGAALESIEFPSTLKNIKSKAFEGCSQLKGIKCNDTDPQDIAPDAFYGIPDNVVLIVPKGTEDLYKARSGWNVFGDRIQSFTMVGQTVSDSYFSYEIYEDDAEDAAGKCVITGISPDCSTTIFWGYLIYGYVSVQDNGGTYHTYVATSIEERAFRNNTNITWMDLSNTSITTIGNKAFSGCSNMYHLDLPKYLENIGDEAFAGCARLGVVSMPNTVSYFGARCFAQTGLYDICKNNTMTYIAEEMYAECPNLTDISFPANIQQIDKGAFAESAVSSVVISGELHNCIDDYAFADCKNLTKVVALGFDPGDVALNAFKGVAQGAVLFVPEGAYDNYNGLPGWTSYLTLRELRNTEGDVFEVGDFKYRVLSFDATGDDNSRQLSLLGVAKGKNPDEVVIPANIPYDDMQYTLSSVGDEAFQNNGNITNADFSACANLQEIGEYAFSGCSKLTTVNLNQALETIHEGAFMASGIQEIAFPQTLRYIQQSAFKDCKLLKEINLNSCYNLEEVENGCFMGTTAVDIIRLPYANECWLFDRAFYQSGVKQLIIPYCIDTDRWTDEVFKDCDNLKDVYTSIYEPKALVSVDIFAGIHPQATLWVVEGFDGLVDTYKTLDGWKDFFADIRENEHVPTNITLPDTHSPLPDPSIYDLQGRKVSDGQRSLNNGQRSVDNGYRKGIYIVNGRKVVVK